MTLEERCTLTQDPQRCSHDCHYRENVTQQRGAVHGRTMRPRKLILLEVALVVGLLLITAMHSYVNEDIWFWDDAGYMARGIQPQLFGAPGWVDSPLYSAIYASLSHVYTNPIDLYLFVRAFTAAFFVGTLWFGARLVAGPVFAWVVAAIASMLPITYIWPGVATPSTGLLVVAVAVTWRWRTALAFSISTGLVWLAAGSRPEFTWIAALASVTALGWWVVVINRTAQASRRVVKTVVVLASTLGLPLLLALNYTGMFARSSREWTAFSQHFALRNTPPGVDSWQSAGDIAARFFPGASSALDALRVNSSAFLEHVGKNAIQFPVSLAGHSLAMEPGSFLAPTTGKLAAILLALSLVLAVWANRHRLIARSRVGLHSATHFPALMSTLLTIGIVLGSSAAIFVIYPRPHYLLLPIALALVASACFLSQFSQTQTVTMIPIGSTALLLLIFSVVTISAFPSRISDPPPYESALRQIQDDSGAHRLVAGDHPIELFLPGTTVLDSPPESAINIEDALQKARVDLVQISPALGLGAWKGLDGYTDFIKDPTTLGFRQVDPRTPLWIR